MPRKSVINFASGVKNKKNEKQQSLIKNGIVYLCSFFIWLISSIMNFIFSGTLILLKTLIDIGILIFLLFLGLREIFYILYELFKKIVTKLRITIANKCFLTLGNIYDCTKMFISVVLSKIFRSIGSIMPTNSDNNDEDENNDNNDDDDSDDDDEDFDSDDDDEDFDSDDDDIDIEDEENDNSDDDDSENDANIDDDDEYDLNSIDDDDEYTVGQMNVYPKIKSLIGKSLKFIANVYMIVNICQYTYAYLISNQIFNVFDISKGSEIDFENINNGICQKFDNSFYCLDDDEPDNFPYILDNTILDNTIIDNTIFDFGNINKEQILGVVILCRYLTTLATGKI